MKIRFILSVMAILITMMFTMNGCGDSNNVSIENNESADTDVGEGSSFYGTMISGIMGGLEDGATGELGGDTMGLILSYLGWGNSGDSTDTKEMNEMNAKLDVIKDDLNVILGEVKGLIGQMKITEKEILANVNDPSEFMGNIVTSEQQLQDMLGDNVSAGDGNKAAIIKYSQGIEGHNGTENDINQIIFAVKPLDISKSPVLNNFADLLNLRYQSGDASLSTAYSSLELYISQLIYYELKGVNLVVEARNILYDQNLSTATALVYMDRYQDNLTEQIGNPGNDVSFIYNVWRLALLNVSLYPSDKTSFFSQDIKDFLQRAQFYKMRTLSEDINRLHILIFTTKDIKTLDLQYEYKPTGEWSTLDCENLDVSIPGVPYDYWVDNSHIKKVNLYNAYDCQLPYNPGVGTYGIYFNEVGAKFITEATVQKYDENYTVKTDGNITFGLATSVVHPLINHYAESSTNWTLHKDVSKYSTLSGSANDWPIKLVINDDHLGDTIKSNAELRGNFTYAGTEDSAMTVKYKAKYYLHVSAEDCEVCPGWTNIAKASYRTGVHNVTENKGECSESYIRTIEVEAGGDKKDHYYPEHTCSFTAKPGNEYYVYFQMRVETDHNEDAAPYSKSELEDVYYVYIKIDE